jgi:uncharacterized protein YecE (DUF72 family)
MQLLTGTSGFSYKEWKGPFYPEKLATRDMLRFYAERLPAVEINNTFYRMPKASVLESWAAQVPDGFRFVVKASRRITHFKRLKEAGEETEYLFRTLEALGPHLGAVLFQLPPNLPCDALRLESFLALLPDGIRCAFEFRHASWQDPAVDVLLRARGCARVQVDAQDAEPPELEATADWGYLRLRRAVYGPEALASWAARIAARPWREAFVFFKHEDAGAGPRLASELLALASSG